MTKVSTRGNRIERIINHLTAKSSDCDENNLSHDRTDDPSIERTQAEEQERTAQAPNECLGDTLLECSADREA
eukprot:COSAG06_NODE_11368_length_1521_cov_1.383263_2_plen_72_part_01